MIHTDIIHKVLHKVRLLLRPVQHDPFIHVVATDHTDVAVWQEGAEYLTLFGQEVVLKDVPAVLKDVSDLYELAIRKNAGLRAEEC